MNARRVKKMSQISLPVALGVVGSMSYVVWSQKPYTRPVLAAAVTAEQSRAEAASFKPVFEPAVQQADIQPLAVAAPEPAKIVERVETRWVSSSVGSPVNTQSNPVMPERYLLADTNLDSAKTRLASGSQSSSGILGAYGASGSFPTTITTDCAQINVGVADIFVASSFTLHYGDQIITGAKP